MSNPVEGPQGGAVKARVIHGITFDGETFHFPCGCEWDIPGDGWATCSQHPEGSYPEGAAPTGEPEGIEDLLASVNWNALVNEGTEEDWADVIKRLLREAYLRGQASTKDRVAASKGDAGPAGFHCSSCLGWFTDNTEKDGICGNCQDLRMVIDIASEVYMHVTGGKVSKPNTLASEIITLADDEVTTLVEQELSDQAEEKDAAPSGEPVAREDLNELIESYVMASGNCARAVVKNALDIDRFEDEVAYARQEMRDALDRLYAERGDQGEPPTREEPRPNIVCLCGSSRFIERFAVMMWEFEKEGRIALGLHYLPQSYTTKESHQAEHEGVAEAMDELHLRKIDLADTVFVINVGGYIGDSTRREIAYAEKAGKPIAYLETLVGAP